MHCIATVIGWMLVNSGDVQESNKVCRCFISWFLKHSVYQCRVFISSMISEHLKYNARCRMKPQGWGHSQKEPRTRWQPSPTPQSGNVLHL
jgi:hypothetical protein